MLCSTHLAFHHHPSLLQSPRRLSGVTEIKGERKNMCVCESERRNGHHHSKASTSSILTQLTCHRSSIQSHFTIRPYFNFLLYLICNFSFSLLDFGATTSSMSVVEEIWDPTPYIFKRIEGLLEWYMLMTDAQWLRDWKNISKRLAKYIDYKKHHATWKPWF